LAVGQIFQLVDVAKLVEILVEPLEVLQFGFRSAFQRDSRRSIYLCYHKGKLGDFGCWIVKK
jgi:hypothetical protein